MKVEGMNGFAEFFKDYAEHFAVSCRCELPSTNARRTAVAH